MQLQYDPRKSIARGLRRNLSTGYAPWHSPAPSFVTASNDAFLAASAETHTLGTNGMKNLLTIPLATVLLIGCHIDSIYMGSAERAFLANVRAGNIPEVKKFLDNGGRVNLQDEEGCTPLFWAVADDYKGSHTQMVALLIARGADVNALDDTQTAPLHMASNKETAALLIDAGADINTKDYEGRTILHRSARNAANAASKTWTMYLGLVELLVEEGADLNAKDDAGKTTLHVVAQQFDEKKASEICELLITNGARVNEEDSTGRTALDDAIAHQRSETAEVLRKHGGKTAQVSIESADS